MPPIFLFSSQKNWVELGKNKEMSVYPSCSRLLAYPSPIPILNPDPDPDPLLQLHLHPDQHRHHLQHDAIAGHHVALADLSLLRIQVAAGCPPNLQFSPWSGGWLSDRGDDCVTDQIPNIILIIGINTHRNLSSSCSSSRRVEEDVVLGYARAAENLTKTTKWKKNWDFFSPSSKNVKSGENLVQDVPLHHFLCKRLIRQQTTIYILRQLVKGSVGGHEKSLTIPLCIFSHLDSIAISSIMVGM